MFTSSLYTTVFLAALASTAAAQNATALPACPVAEAALDATASDCSLLLPSDPLSAKGLSTPFILQAPCSMSVDTQQAFVEAAIFDPATGKISIYHPLVSDAGVDPAAAPVVPTLPSGAVVGLWFGSNGGNLDLVDAEGKDANSSPLLKAANCVNGLPGSDGDVFGQVSFCNAEQWFTAVNAGVKAGKVEIPALGKDKNGNDCPSSRSFSFVDSDPQDSVSTQYLLVGNATAQNTDANRKALKNGDIIDNDSDAALLMTTLDPAMGCTPFLAPSLDNAGAMVASVALAELQASLEKSPAFVPLNDPDCLANGKTSAGKTNAYRAAMGQPPVGAGATSGDLTSYCDGMVAGAPSFLQSFEKDFLAQGSPDKAVGGNLFTFMCGRYLSSLESLNCPPPAVQPITCKLDGNKAATSCAISLSNATSTDNSTNTDSTTTAASLDTSTSVSLDTSTTASVKYSNNTIFGGNGNTAGGKDQNNGNDAGKTTAADSAAQTTTVASVLAATTSDSVVTQVIEVEVISFFIFIINLGGALPPAVLNHDKKAGHFVVLEEVFVEFAPACQRACNHQFSSCTSVANAPHATFAAADCKKQEDSCLGVAATATTTNSVPATVTATATVVTSTTAAAVETAAGSKSNANSGSNKGSQGSSQSESGAQSGAQSGGSKGSDNNNNSGAKDECPAPTATMTITAIVSKCTAVTEKTVYVTVTASSTTVESSSGYAAATASAGLPHAYRHAKHRRAVGNY